MTYSLKNLLGSAIVTSLCALTTVVQSAEQETKLSFSTTEVAPGLYMLMGVGGFTGGNIALSVGDDGVVMIDDSMPPMLGIMQQAISSITDKPVDFLINTHVHGDHTGNNTTIGKDGTWIVAHNNLRQYMLEHGIDGEKGMVKAPKSALPVITFDHSMNFHLNGKDAYIFHLPNAHTSGDAAIHYQQSNVIHTGDVMFNGMFPYIDIDKGGSIDGFIAAQKELLQLTNDQTKIIPGHGPLANKADLQASIAMLEDAKTIISTLINEGKTVDQLVTLNPLSKYHDQWNWSFITTERMTRQLYKGLVQSREIE